MQCVKAVSLLHLGIIPQMCDGVCILLRTLPVTLSVQVLARPFGANALVAASCVVHCLQVAKLCQDMTLLHSVSRRQLAVELALGSYQVQTCILCIFLPGLRLSVPVPSRLIQH